MICRFSANPIKILRRCFVEIYKLIIKSLWNEKPKMAKTILNKKNKVRGFVLPDFQSYYKVTIISTNGQSDWQMEQWKAESRNRAIYLHRYWFFKNVPKHFNTERKVFQQITETTGYHSGKKVKLYYITIYKKVVLYYHIPKKLTWNG